MKIFLLHILLFHGLVLAAINPLQEYQLTPEKLNISYESYQLLTPDNCQLKTWVMYPKEETKNTYTFIIANSDAGNMGYSLPYAAQLLARGYTVVTFDYRGFGDSSDFDFKSTYLYHDEYITDFNTVVDWVKKEHQLSKVAVLAFSMGTIIANLGYEKTSFDLLVGEGVVTDPLLQIERVKASKNKLLNTPKSAIKVLSNLEKLPIPMLFFGGTEDVQTPLRDAEAVIKNHFNRRLVTFAGAHLQGVSVLGIDRYFGEIVSMASYQKMY